MKGFSAIDLKKLSDDDKHVYLTLTKLRKTLLLPMDVWFKKRPSITSKLITKAVKQLDKERMYLINGRYSFIEFDLTLDELEKCFKCPKNLKIAEELETQKKLANKLYSSIF
jgi:hypothetical protein